MAEEKQNEEVGNKSDSPEKSVKKKASVKAVKKDTASVSSDKNEVKAQKKSETTAKKAPAKKKEPKKDPVVKKAKKAVSAKLETRKKEDFKESKAEKPKAKTKAASKGLAIIKLTQIKSVIDRPKRQKATMVALGLTKINKTVEKEATPQILGMVRKISHLIKVEEA